MTWQENIDAVLKAEKNKIVSIDLVGKTVDYSSKIKNNRDVKVLRGPEEVVTAFLVNKLVNQLHYKEESLELEKTYLYKTMGRKKGKAGQEGRIDVIVKDDKGNPFYFIEVKEPDKWETDKSDLEGQLFNLAEEEQKKYKTKAKYLVYYTVDQRDGQIVDRCLIIDFVKYPTFTSWTEANSPVIGDELAAGYDKPKKVLKRKGDPNHDLRTQISPREINQLATNLHNVLWGGGGTNDSEIFYSLVNIILAKIQDESEREDGEEYEFQIRSYGDSTETAESVFDRVTQLYKRALEQKLNISGVNELAEARIIDRNKFSLNKLMQAVEKLEDYSFLEGRSALDGRDILGDFFEQITRDGFKQNKGQFFTPTPVVKFLLYTLQIDKLALERLNKDREVPYIIDPSMGSGTFLIEAMKVITKEVKYKQVDDVKSSRQVSEKFNDLFTPPHRENRWAKDYLYGTEINFDLGTASKVNMILHGDGATNIFVKDGLLPFRQYDKDTAPNYLKIHDKDPLYQDKEVNAKFDVVISNPPFSVDLDTETKRSLNASFLFGGKKNSENLFLERYYQILRENGRLGVVLPESVFDTTENKYIRLFLFKYFKIKGVVSLPQVTFEPFTSTKTSLLFAQKKTATEIKAWNQAWGEAVKEYNKLRTRVENYAKVYIDGEDVTKYPSIRDHTEDEAKTQIARFLKNYITDEDHSLSVKEILETYTTELKEVNTHDNDLKDIFGYANAWWVFGVVAETMDVNYPIFLAEAEHVGYKRTKRGEKPQPNDLYDIEVAPAYIDCGVVLADYDEQISLQNAQLAELNNELSEAQTAHLHKASRKIAEDIDRINQRITDLQDTLDILAAEKATVSAFLSEYYPTESKRKGEWRLKADSVDRTDATLSAMFEPDAPLFRYRSEDVLLRRNEVIKLLDQARKEIVWE